MHYKEYKTILSPKNGMNIYRGCTHGCIYCDSRSKCYHMDHDFTDIEIKMNAPEILDKELSKKRKPVMVGTGSMTDPYLHLEEDLKYTRECLKVILKHHCGVTIITKSARILRDLDLLKQINSQAEVVVQITLTTADDDLCKIIEPAVSVTSERVEVLRRLHEAGIPTIVWFTPLLPYINDTKENILKILDYCSETHVYGILFFGVGLTLRDGNREYFYKQLDLHFPGLRKKYEEKYGLSYEIASDYNASYSSLIRNECKKRGIVLNNDHIFHYLEELPEKENKIETNLFTYSKETKDINIREATQEDINRIAFVHYHSWHETYLGLMPYEFLKLRTIDSSIKSLTKNIDNCIVAEVEKKIVGFVIYRQRAREIVKQENTGEIQALYVLEQYQYLGIGTKLLEKVIDLIESKKVALFVLSNNEHAIEFYLRKGFAFTGNKITQAVPGGVLKESEMVYIK